MPFQKIRLTMTMYALSSSSNIPKTCTTPGCPRKIPSNMTSRPTCTASLAVRARLLKRLMATWMPVVRHVACRTSELLRLCGQNRVYLSTRSHQCLECHTQLGRFMHLPSLADNRHVMKLFNRDIYWNRLPFYGWRGNLENWHVNSRRDSLRGGIRYVMCSRSSEAYNL
jgi:hypothetical protein